MSLRFSGGGSNEEFRLVPDNAASGLWLDPLPTTHDEFVTVLRGGRLEERVTAVRFQGGRATESGGDINLAWAELTPAP